MAQDLKVVIVGDASKLTKTLDESKSSFSGTVKEWAKGALTLAGVQGAISGVVGIAKDAIDAATQEQTAQAKLNAVFTAAHLPIGQYRDVIEKAEASGRALGFTNVDTINSLGGFVAATKNVKESTDLMGVSENLARFKHESLAAASKTLTSTMAGNTRAARELGIQFIPLTTNVDALKAKYAGLHEVVPAAALDAAKLADKQLNAREVIDKVSSAVKGQASAYADTAAGAADKFHASLDNLEAILGEKILPVLATVAGAVSNFIEGIQAGTGAGGEFASAISTGFNDVKNVVVPIVKAIIDGFKAFVGVIEDNWSTISKFAQPIVDEVKIVIQYFKDLVQFVKDLIDGDWSKALGDLVKVFTDAFGGIINYLGDVLKDIGMAASAIGKAILNGILDGLKGLGRLIVDTIKDGAKELVDAGAWVLGQILDGLKGVADFADKAARWVKNQIVDGIKGVADDLGNVGSSILDMITGGLKGVATFGSDAFSWIMKQITGGLKDVGKDLAGVGSSLIDFIAGGLTSATKTVADAAVKIGASILTGIGNGLKGAVSLAGNIAEDIGKAIQGAINGIIDAINGGIDKIHVHLPIVGDVGLPKDPLPHVSLFASGTSYAPGGLAIIGERGPELVSLPRGSSVSTAAQTSALLGGKSAVHYHFEIGQIVANDPQTLVDQLRIWTQRNGSLAAAGVG